MKSYSTHNSQNKLTVKVWFDTYRLISNISSFSWKSSMHQHFSYSHKSRYFVLEHMFQHAAYRCAVQTDVLWLRLGSMRLLRTRICDPVDMSCRCVWSVVSRLTVWIVAVVPRVILWTLWSSSSHAWIRNTYATTTNEFELSNTCVSHDIAYPRADTHVFLWIAYPRAGGLWIADLERRKRRSGSAMSVYVCDDDGIWVNSGNINRKAQFTKTN